MSYIKQKNIQDLRNQITDLKSQIKNIEELLQNGEIEKLEKEKKPAK